MNPSPKSPEAGEQTIFDAARQLPDARERAAYLESACSGNAFLRERIEKLLKAGERADEFLAQNPLGPLTPALSPSDGARENAAGVEGPGTIIGHYKLLEKLGEGGFGVVYMAEQKQPIKRRVALKIIKIGMDTREVVARFEAERQALALMDHPNIAKVFDAGMTETAVVGQASRVPSSLRPSRSQSDPAGETPAGTATGGTPAPLPPAGRPYFVMELVRGIKITDYCDEKNLSTHERLDLFTQVCQAVQHAHQKGIIHRDLKPSNILVTVNDGVAVPKIIDFGIAKATQLELTEKTVFTRFHQFLGTPAYMSPEQTELTSVDIDTRSDIYSLGVLLYELLTGQTPFDTKELLKAGLDEMRRTIREVEPVKPSTRLTQELSRTSRRPLTPSLSPSGGEGVRRTGEGESRSTANIQHLKQLIPALRGDLDWIVMKCLEKDRARRYETANGLATDIQRHLNNEPVVACPPSNLYKFQKLVRRNKVAFGAGAGIAAALVIGLAVALWQSIEKTRAYNRAVAAEKAAQTEAAKSRQVAQYLKDVIQDLGPSVALVHEPAMVRGILDRASERIDRDLANQPQTAIELRETVAAIYGELGLFDKMAELARKNLELAQATFGEENLAVANAVHQLGEAAFWRDKLAEAEKFTLESLRVRRKLLGNEQLDVAKSLLQLGNIFHERASNADAQAAYREGLAICGSLPVSDEQRLVEADLLQDLGLELRGQEAEALSRRALEIKRKLLGGAHSSVAEALEILALKLKEEGKLAEAEARGEEALATYRKLFGKDHHLVGRALGGLGATLSQQGRLAEAESLLREAVATEKKTLGNDMIEVTWTLHHLAQALAQQGKLAEAEGAYREVLAIRQKLSVNPRGQLLLQLAGVLRKQGKHPEANALLPDAIAAFRKQADGGEIGAQNDLAWFLATHPSPQLRDGRTAVTYAERAAAAMGRKHAGYLDTLAAAHAEAGDFEKAVSVQKEAIALNNNEALNGEFVSRLKLYESGSPYRESE